MAGDDTTLDPLFRNVLRRPRKEEPGGGYPCSVVGNASESPPLPAPAASNNRPSSVTGDFFPNKAHVTDALRTILARLDASDLTLVYEKHMEASDRSKGQNRLLMSCKCETKRAAFASIFTDTEMPLVHRPEPLKTTQEDEEHDTNDQHGGKDKGKNKEGVEYNSNKGCRNNNGNHKTKCGMGQHKHKCGGKAEDDDYEEDDECSVVVGKEDADKQQDDDDEQGKQRSKAVHQGLAVEAYDCDGRTYKLNLKYLSSNTAYRIIGPEWTVFLENNGLLVVAGGGGAVTTRKPSAGRLQKKRRSSLPDGEEPPPNDEHRLAVRDAAGDIHMELWAFRSPKLSIGVKDQPGGALGLLLLHYRGRGRGGEAGTEEVAAPQEPEDMVAAGDCGRDAAPVEDDAAGKLGHDAAPPSTPLGPVERLVVVWLSYNDHSDDAGVNDNGEPGAKQRPK